MRKTMTLLCLFIGICWASAQTKITGTVISSDDGQPVIGATVVAKGTSVGTVTNVDGNFTISLPSGSKTLVISYVGMATVEAAPQNGMKITLKADTKQIKEVVVTALGIQRDKKTLAYSSQQVSGDEMLKAKDINFMNSLSGKAAGIEIKKSVSGAGGSTRTVLRGSKSWSQLSEPLYVIDGVPMVNHKGDQSGMWGGTDEGDGLSQINPDDIESVSILKGSNAAILYGSQGANGVVIITTKKGKEGTTNVTFSSSTLFESVMSTPNLQYKYGSEGGAKESWSYTPGNYASNYVKDFFQTGANLVNTVSISGGNNKTTAYFSYGNTLASGVIPNNKYVKNNVTFQQSTKLLNDKLTVRSNVMLTSEKANNRNTAGYYLNPLTGLYLFPRDKDFSSYQNNYQVFSKDRNMYLQNWFVADHMQSNPYWLINKQPKTDLTKRVIASVSADYQISKKIKFQTRASYDYAVKSYEQKYYAGGNTVNISENGRWSYKKFDDMMMYTDGIFTYTDKFGDFSVNGVLGASYQKSVLGNGVSVDNGSNSLLYPNEFYFQNLPTNVQVQSTYSGEVIKEGAFANAQIGYKDMIYLDLSGRNDWSSTLVGTGNDSYFYPSFGLTGILSQMVKMPSAVTFAKVRASYAKVANDVPFNKISAANTINSSAGIDKNTVAPFTNAKPEMLTTIEVGTDWRFFGGRLGLDFTYYNIASTNQFISSSNVTAAQQLNGYSSFYYNAGKIVNKGLEIVLTTIPVKSRNLEWKSTFNFSRNVNKIVELVPGYPDRYIDMGASEGYVPRLYQGGSFGDIYGLKFVRNSSGQIILDATTGAPTKTKDPQYLGNLEPKFSLGWSNGFSYKQFALNFLVNAKIGGKCFSQTEAILDGYGVSERTAVARDNGGVAINAIKGTTPVTKIDAKLYYTTVGDRNGVSEAYVYDRTNIRLTQLSLSYDLNVSKLKIPVKAASISLVGNNLFFIYKKAPYDPELTMSTGLGSQSLDNFNVPSTRTYGFNLKVSF
ncbi:MAG: SusC/RagA family TonB-linked outer membrane protein [Bacteroidota bacterium]|nr:SusC/RagA family TonB-linked outer membrane protein [Bacteroidota bacterium]MDP4269448.1 SusC/RagA family TonB-linked outer membrane protein [Bacteroidota bacterium]